MVLRRNDGFVMGAAYRTGDTGRSLTGFPYFFLRRYGYAIRLCRSEVLWLDGSQDGQRRIKGWACMDGIVDCCCIVADIDRLARQA
jgi:hypothetical protein